MGIATVLICDESEAVHESLTSCLNSVNIDTVSAYDVEKALAIMKARRIDLVILDTMMPKIFETEICKIIRKTSDMPVIMLIARDEDADRIQGLEPGADNYITKPFSPREAMAKVLAVLNRTAPKMPGRKLFFRELLVDMDAFEVYVNGRKIYLTPKEKKVIAFLVSNPGTALSRDSIIDAVWGRNYYGDTRAVDTLIKRIRHKLPGEGVHFEITSVYSVGYRLDEKHE